MLLSKLSEHFATFDTLLYTCSDVFDFMSAEVLVLMLCSVQCSVFALRAQRSALALVCKRAWEPARRRPGA